jgi:membrane dipeptidase
MTYPTRTGRDRLVHRRSLLAGALAAATGLPAAALAQTDAERQQLGFTPDPASLARARALLARTGAADLHAHPGGAAATPSGRVFDVRVAEDMRAGFVTAASFAAVADTATLARTADGIVVAREFQPGEALESYRRQIANLRAAAEVGRLTVLRAPRDLRATKPGRDVGVFLTVEGGDFLEQDLARVEAAFADGVRCITLVHYRPNALGDNQTSPPSRGGLTPFGGKVVKEMNRLGMLVDVAHAAETTVRQVLERSSAPVMCSHTILKSAAFDHPRFLTADTARAIAAAGGVVGAWPSGFGATTMSQFVDRIFRLTEVVGPDHAALGTDMDGNYMPVVTSYRQTPLLVSELLRRGYGEANAAKFISGNFQRLWTRVARG